MRFAVLALLCAGCPQNPHQLWIAQNGSESQLKLDDSEPNPF
jgi:hypothetical protein